jgi:hypothetical protein
MPLKANTATTVTASRRQNPIARLPFSLGAAGAASMVEYLRQSP